MRCVVAALLVLCAVNEIQASPLTLVSGRTEALVGGPTTVPFSAAEVAAISDGSLATGLSFTSLPAATAPLIFGFDQTFEFDVSGLSNIQSIAFTWTGRYTWTGNLAFPDLQLAPDEGLAMGTFGGFGSGSVPTNSVQTASLLVIAGAADAREALASSLVNPGLAQFNIETVFGSGASGDLSSITLETLEVTADVQFASVPEPATLLLLGAGLVTAGVRRRRNQSLA